MSSPSFYLKKIQNLVPDFKTSKDSGEPKEPKDLRESESLKSSAASLVQNHYRVYRHNQTLKTFMGIDISRSSPSNFENLRTCLREFPILLKTCLTEPRTKQLSEELHYYQSYQDKILLPYEVELFNHIIAGLTIKHATSFHQEIKESGEMLSLKQRERLKMPVENRHTAKKYGVDDDVYFVLGIGNHSTPLFLSNASHEVTINLMEMAKQDRQSLKRLWIGGHLTDYQNESSSNPITVGNAKYYFTHNWENRSKTYYIEREDGARLQWIVSMQSEVYAGSQVIPAVAFQLILMLRLLGRTNPYVVKLFKTILNKSVANTEKEESLSLIMSLLFPGWVYPEAKMAVKVEINKPYIKISERILQDEEGNVSSDILFDNARLFNDAIEDGNFKKVHYYLKQGFSPNIRIRQQESTPLMVAIKLKKWDIAVFLLKHGADINLTNTHIQIPQNALHYAVLYGTPEFLDFILKTAVSNKKEPLIKHLPNIHVKDSLNLDLIGLACSLGFDADRNWYLDSNFAKDEGAQKLKILLKYFPKFKSSLKTPDYVNISVKYANYAALTVLGDLKVNVNAKIHWGKTALMLAIEKNKARPSFAADLVTYLLKIGANINVQYQERIFSALTGKTYFHSSDNGKTALHFAVEYNCLEVVKVLLNNGADCSIKTSDGRTALDLVTEKSNVEIISILKEKMNSLEEVVKEPPAKRIRIELKESRESKESKESGESIEKEHFVPETESVVCLVLGEDKPKSPYVLLGRKRNKKGFAEGDLILPGGHRDRGDAASIDAAIRELREKTGLNIKEAYLKKQIMVTEILTIKYEKTRDGMKKIRFYLFDIRELSRHQKITIMPNEDLVELRRIPMSDIVAIDKPIGGRDFFEKSSENQIRKSNALMIDYLCKATAPKLTIEQEQEIAEIFLLEVNGEAILGEAAKANNLDKMKAILNQNSSLAKKECEFNCPIKEMVLHRNYEGVKFLLDSGMDINDYSYCSKPLAPLNAAIRQNDVLMVKFLLERGALANCWKGLPLREAAEVGSLEIIDLLIKAGANVNFANRYNSALGSYILIPPIIKAIKKGHAALVKELLETYGENLNLERTPIKRNTPLQTAIRYLKPEIAFYLLTQIPGLHKRNKEKKTALDLAVQYNYPDLHTAIQFLAIYPTPYHLFMNRFGFLPAYMKVKRDDNNELCLHVGFRTQENADLYLKIMPLTTFHYDADRKLYVRLGVYRYAKLGKTAPELFKNFFAAYLTHAKQFLEIPCELQKTIYELIANKIQDFSYDYKTYGEAICNVSNMFLRALSEGKSLINWVQDCRNITPSVWGLILQGIRKSTSLKSITLINLPTFVNALDELQIAIADSKSIKNITIGDHLFSTEDILGFLEGLKSNGKLLSLTLDCGNIKNVMENIISFVDKAKMIVPLKIIASDKKVDSENSILKNLQMKNRLEWIYQNSTPDFKTKINSLRDKTTSKFLKHYNLSSDQIDLIAHHLSGNENLVQLGFYGCTFSSFGLNLLGQFLVSNKTIQHFQFSGNQISSDQINSILDCLMLRKYPLHTINLNSTSLTSENMDKICKILDSELIRLRSLDLRYITLKDTKKGLLNLGQALGINRHLRHLEISCLDDGYKETEKQFSECLQKNRNLITIKPSFFSYVTKETLKSIAERNIVLAIKNNSPGYFWSSQNAEADKTRTDMDWVLTSDEPIEFEIFDPQSNSKSKTKSMNFR